MPPRAAARRRASLVVLAPLLLPAALPAAARSQASASSGAAPPSDDPGVVGFHAPCAPDVRAGMDRAVALLHHMTYPVADSLFEAVAVRDPGCALAFWGRAMTLFHPLWPTRPDADALERGWALAGEARRRVGDDARGSRLVAGVEAFFDPARGDYWERIDAWAAATEALHVAHPDDLDAAALHALALLATDQRSGTAEGHHARAADILAGVLAREPRHPGGMHYTIHANDFAGRERMALDVVRGYADIAPETPHALHMPSHVFVRLGAWDDAIAWNRRAARAALAQRVGPGRAFVWDEYPHAVEYLVYAHLQEGDDGAAADAWTALAATPDLEPTFKTAFHLASIPARIALEGRDWAAAAALRPREPASVPWDRFPWPEAVARFAAGMGAAHRGDGSPVAAALERLDALRRAADDGGEALFAAQIDILRLELAAAQARGEGRAGDARALLEEAVALEARTPRHAVTPGPTLPAGDLLGDLLAELGDAGGALAAYRASDARWPGRFNTVLGIARAAEAAGDDAAAREAWTRLLEGAGASSRPGVAEARARLGRG